MSTDTWLCSDKQIRYILRGLERAGWTVRQTKACLKVYNPLGVLRFTAPITPSDRRWVTIIKSRVRRAEESAYAE